MCQVKVLGCNVMKKKVLNFYNGKHFFPGTLYPPSIQSETKEQLTRTVAKNDGRNVNNSSPSFA